MHVHGYSNQSHSHSAEYQTRQIVKYVPESMRIPSSNLKLQDAAVGQGNYVMVRSHFSLLIRCILKQSIV